MRLLPLQVRETYLGTSSGRRWLWLRRALTSELWPTATSTSLNVTLCRRCWSSTRPSPTTSPETCCSPTTCERGWVAPQMTSRRNKSVSSCLQFDFILVFSCSNLNLTSKALASLKNIIYNIKYKHRKYIISAKQHYNLAKLHFRCSSNIDRWVTLMKYDEKRFKQLVQFNTSRTDSNISKTIAKS